MVHYLYVIPGPGPQAPRGHYSCGCCGELHRVDAVCPKQLPHPGFWLLVLVVCASVIGGLALVLRLLNTLGG